MDQIVLTWNVVGAFLAGIPVLSVIGVYLLARFTSTFDAYASERSKMKAQFDNIERLVTHTERMTMASETVKAQKAFEEERWKTKLEFYQSLFRTMSALRDGLNQLMWDELLLPRTTHIIDRLMNPTEDQKQVNAAVRKGYEDMRSLLLFGQIVVALDGHQCLKVLKEAVNLQEGDRELEDIWRVRYKRLDEALPKAILHARVDLGFAMAEPSAAGSELATAVGGHK